MKVTPVHYQTFKRGSKTYFNSSLFFPENVRRDVFALYGFVRVADDFVDATPQDADGFHRFTERYYRAVKGTLSGDTIVDSFVELLNRKAFDSAWVDAFLHSMEMDLTKRSYESLDETLEYIYGSAEVIGLFMARIMNLPSQSYESARMQGRSMQYINFIRDIDEDLSLGRRYLPLSGSPLESLEHDYVRSHAEEFGEFVRHHLDLYRRWQTEAERGYRYIPKRYLIPIKTASDMYGWTARRIENNPLVVYTRKVKPPKFRIMLQVIKNALLL
jgi:phytoene synthase